MNSSKFYPLNIDWSNTTDPAQASRMTDVVIKENKIPELVKSPYTLVIDSRDRNTTFYPDPNNYTVIFENPYRDVLSVELTLATIPHSGYNVNSTNNKLSISIDGITFTDVTISPGNYNAFQLVSTLKTQIDAIISPYKSYVKFDKITGKLTITVFTNVAVNVAIAESSNEITVGPNPITDAANVANFSMNFLGTSTLMPNGTTRPQYLTGTIGEMLGFNAALYSGSSSYTAPRRLNLFGEKYLVLNIPELDNLDGISDAIDGAFAIINLESDVMDSANNLSFKNTNKVIKGSDMGTHSVIKTFSPVKNSLKQFTIQFKTYNNDLYDFNGQDHMIMFQITTVKQTGDYGKFKMF